MAVKSNDDTKDRVEGSTIVSTTPNTIIIDEKSVLAATGDNRLESIRQLIMRGMRLKSFESTCVSKLRNLTVLSLSNNKLRDLGSFAPLVNLVELNINFNAVTSLQGLACPGLQKLYISNNLVANAARLRGFPKLQTLCLFKNILPDLNSALESLRGLADLRELDLDGNPCARSLGYKHRVIHSCPRLHALDGEDISQLDRDLSSLFFEEKRTNLLWANTDGTSTGPDRRRRPATAPVSATRRRDASASRPGTAARGALGLPAGEARLLRSDRLNNDPQLLSYLAEGVLANPCGSPRDAIGSLKREGNACAMHSEDYEGGLPDDASTEPQDMHQEEPPVMLLSTIPQTEQRLSRMGASDCRGEKDGGRGRFATSLQQPDSSSGSTNGQGEQGRGRGGRRRRGGGHDQCVASPVDGGSNNAVGRGEGSADGGRALSELDFSKEQHQEEEEEVVSSRQAPTTDVDDSTCGFGCTPTESVTKNDLELAPNGGVGGRRTSRNSTIFSSGSGKHDAEKNAPPSVVARAVHGGETGGRRLTTGRKSARVSGRQEELSPPPLSPPPPPPPPPPSSLPPSRSETTDLEPSNPYTTIRKLLKLVETLQLERADREDNIGRTGDRRYANGGDKEDKSSPMPLIGREDVKLLRLENRNMWLLLAENRELKHQAQEESARAEKVQRELREELARVKRDLEAATQKFEAVVREKVARSSSAAADGNTAVFASTCSVTLPPPSAVDGVSPSRRKGISGTTSSLRRRPPSDTSSDLRTAATKPGTAVGEDLESVSSEDGEVEELFRRNRRTMGEIRRDLALARRESESWCGVSGGGGGGGGGIMGVGDSDSDGGGVDGGRAVAAGQQYRATPSPVDSEAGKGEDKQKRTRREQRAAVGSSPPTLSMEQSARGQKKGFPQIRAPFHEGGGQADTPGTTPRRGSRYGGHSPTVTAETRVVDNTLPSEPPSVSELLMSLERSNRTLQATDSARCCTGKVPPTETASDDGGLENLGVPCEKRGWLRKGPGKSDGGWPGRETTFKRRLERRASRDEHDFSGTGVSRRLGTVGSGCDGDACDGDLAEANRRCSTKLSKEAVSVSSGVRGMPRSRSRGGAGDGSEHAILPATGRGNAERAVAGIDEEGGRVTMFASNARALLTS